METHFAFGFGFPNGSQPKAIGFREKEEEMLDLEKRKFK